MDKFVATLKWLKRAIIWLAEAILLGPKTKENQHGTW